MFTATEPIERDLSTKIFGALSSSRYSLMTLDTGSKEWIDTPWPEVAFLGQGVADWLLAADRDGDRSPIGIVGDPTMETIAIVCGVWGAGRPIAILPGPVRGTTEAAWAEVTMAKFAALGCAAVFAHDGVLSPLARFEAGPQVLALPTVRAWRATEVRLDQSYSGQLPAVLQGTAGSTGTPKTAVLSRDSLLNHCIGLEGRLGGGVDSDIGCTWLPLYHDMGLTSLIVGLVYGGQTWLAPTSAFARSPFEWLRWLSMSRATLTAAPNFAYNLLGRYARRVDDIDLSNMRYAINGGEPVDCDGLSRFCDEMARFGFDARAVAPSYGLAEATCAVSAPHPMSGLTVDRIEIVESGAARPLAAAALGPALPGMEIRVVPRAAGDLEVTGRDVGDIEIRGHTMMSGYRESAPIDPADWFPTGDIGYLHEGQLYVCGRSKEMITIAGRNLFPQQVENAVSEIPGVRAGGVVATVVATGGGRSIRRPELVVVAEFRGKDADQARSRIQQAVAAECGVVPSNVELVSPGALPRTTSGKLRRLEVGGWFADRKVSVE
ncbi:long-chain-fatty acid--ACP ligase MbtM [Nocardia sp. NPDC050793]|uniref:long-chain-fatty acid--ACP ligase MbtM n=1 Tax=Nocardia sp. NPDC050793 TaxID=3155159 RepID=UPI0034116884